VCLKTRGPCRHPRGWPLTDRIKASVSAAGDPLGRIPAGHVSCHSHGVAQLEAYLAANRHSLPATPGLIEPAKARSNGPYSPVQHHPATRCDRLILKQVAGDRLSPVGRFVLTWPKRLIPDDGATGDQGSQNRPHPRTAAVAVYLQTCQSSTTSSPRHARSYME
jgi:hypothetical protein